MRPFQKRLVGAGFIALTAGAGCETVEPWQRGTLAREDMAWQTDVMDATLKDHIYFSKEASSGGSGAGGGGCGCN
jgi:hypothetical protein